MKLKDVLSNLDAKEEGLVVIDDEKIQLVHCVLLEMLKDFDEICIQNGIEWCLAGGSILGALRHHGFIPWDDDVDIHMTRSEYEKLRKVFQENQDTSEIIRKYLLKSPGDSNYLYHFPKIYKRETLFREIQSSNDTPNGFFMDIFILEDTYDSKARRVFHSLQCNFFLLAISALRSKACEDTMLKYTRKNKIAQKEIKKRSRLSLFFSFKDLSWWLKKADKCFEKANNPNSKMVVVPTGAAHYLHELYPRSEMCASYKRVSFEDLELPVPCGAEEIMAKRYGRDYMQIPPEEKRERHAIIEMKI